MKGPALYITIIACIATACGSATGGSTASTGDPTAVASGTDATTVALAGVPASTLESMGIRLTSPPDASPVVTQDAALRSAQELFAHPPIGSALATCTFFDATGINEGRTQECWAFNIDPSGDVEYPGVAATNGDESASTGGSVGQTKVTVELVFVDSSTGKVIKGISGSQ